MTIVEGILLAVSHLLDFVAEQMKDADPDVDIAETQRLMRDCELRLSTLRAWQERLKNNAE